MTGVSKFTKASALGAAALAATFALASVNEAEARYGRKGALIGGLAAGALVGGALLAAPRPVYGAPVVVEEGPSCYFVRERVWDDYRERWVRVRRRVCE